MNGQNAVREAMNGRGPIMVVIREQEGFRVYAATNPHAVEHVGGTPRAPTCTCAEYRSDTREWGGRCAHIDAVYRQTSQESAVPQHARDTNMAPPQAVASGNGQGEQPEAPVQLVLKRSVSPDGRIDSLSVEIVHTMDPRENGELVQQALNTMAVQDLIVGSFLQQGRPHGNGHSGNGHAHAGNGYAPPAEVVSANGAVPAEMTHIGGMQTRRGYSLYINVRANGQDIRLFGNKEKLGGYIADAAYRPESFQIANNTQLHLPCQVILGQKPDSKYSTVEQVLPQVDLAGAGRGTR